MSADGLFSLSWTQTIGLPGATMALLNCPLFLVVSPLRERDRSEDEHLRDQFRARVRHRHGECVLPHLRSHFNRDGESLKNSAAATNVFFRGFTRKSDRRLETTDKNILG